MIVNIRAAKFDDVKLMTKWVREQAISAKLLPRSSSDIKANIHDFIVYENEHGNIVGCGALEKYNNDLAEIRTLVVSKEAQGLGAGKKIVEALLFMAKEQKVTRVIALTFVPDFFYKMNFKLIERELLPEKIWRVCIRCPKFFLCDEVAVVYEINNTSS